MGRKGKKRSPSRDEDKENRKIQRKIRRLEEKLDRRKDERHKRSTSRSRSRQRRDSRRSPRRETSRSPSRGRLDDQHSSTHIRERSRTRYTPRQSRTRSESHHSQNRNQSSNRSRTRLSLDQYASKSPPARSPSRHSSIPRSRRDQDRADRSPSRHSRNEEAITNKPNDKSEVTESSGDTTRKIPEHEVELQEEILNVIGSRLEADKKTAAAVHKDVALRWSEILKKGLPEEEVKVLLGKYPAPENCTFIVAPKLNVEIIASVQENATKRDKRIVEKQERIAACLAAMGRAISVTLKIDNIQKLELLENLSDAGRLLASIHREESLARKGLILANLNSSLKNTLSDTSVDEWLFGADLEEKMKTAKNLERTSKDLKPPGKPLQQNNAQKNTKNSRGPPRQSTYKKRPMTSSGRQQPWSRTSDTKKSTYRKEPTRQYGKRR